MEPINIASAEELAKLAKKLEDKQGWKQLLSAYVSEMADAMFDEMDDDTLMGVLASDGLGMPGLSGYLMRYECEGFQDWNNDHGRKLKELREQHKNKEKLKLYINSPVNIKGATTKLAQDTIADAISNMPDRLAMQLFLDNANVKEFIEAALNDQDENIVIKGHVRPSIQVNYYKCKNEANGWIRGAPEKTAAYAKTAMGKEAAPAPCCEDDAVLVAWEAWAYAHGNRSQKTRETFTSWWAMHKDQMLFSQPKDRAAKLNDKLKDMFIQYVAETTAKIVSEVDDCDFQGFMESTSTWYSACCELAGEPNVKDFDDWVKSYSRRTKGDEDADSN
jgi:hypothetical protein